MGKIIIIDTGVLLNVLDIPGNNERRVQVVEQLEEYLKEDASFHLPMAVVMETGNHIADLETGGYRRKYAKIFVNQIRDALANKAPWKISPFPSPEEMLQWLDQFPDFTKEKFGIADMTIYNTWKELCDKHPMSHIKIWSLDKKLASYERTY